MTAINCTKIIVTSTEGLKCPRCRHYHYFILNYDNLCDRCCNTILEEHPEYNEEVTSGIINTYKKQSLKWKIPLYFVKIVGENLSYSIRRFSKMEDIQPQLNKEGIFDWTII